LNDATKAFLKQAYKRYYFGKSGAIEFPEDLSSREFGYMPFGGGMVRHLAFKSAGEAVAEILRQTPSSVYLSNARYSSPKLPMDEKGWIGAELIFDIDATDIPTPCKKGHDVWYCENCHGSGKLPRPDACPKCRGATAELHGTCAVCLEAAKDHTRRVVEFLVDDFGSSRSAIRIYFSGNRGYHLHVYDSRFDALNKEARAEIADYVRGETLIGQSITASLKRRGDSSKASDGGWMKRIEGYVEAHREGQTATPQKLVSEAIGAQRALVDASVTTDVHRVFRLAGTLHGNTGMSKMRVASLDSFDAARDPVVLGSEPVKVGVSYFPRFSLGGNQYGPFKEETVTMPTYAAVTILTRGFGEVAS
jgi:DNA primase small subunit